MNSATHAAIAAACCSIFYPQLDAICVSAIAAQIPDIDSSRSSLGSLFYPLSTWLEKTVLHRGFTHSILFATFLSLIVAISCWYFQISIWPQAFTIGIFSSLLSDCFTKQGCKLFWPAKYWCVVGLNPQRRLKSGSPIEYWIILVAGLVLSLSLSFNGFQNLLLQLPSNSVDVFLNYPTYCIGAKIKAKHLISQEIVSGNFLATSDATFWRPGQTIDKNYSIIWRSLKPLKDCQVQTQRFVFDDQKPTELFKYSDKYVFVFGTLQGSEGKIEYSGTPIGSVVVDDWVTGSLTLKIYSDIVFVEP